MWGPTLFNHHKLWGGIPVDGFLQEQTNRVGVILIHGALKYKIRGQRDRDKYLGKITDRSRRCTRSEQGQGRCLFRTSNYSETNKIKYKILQWKYHQSQILHMPVVTKHGWHGRDWIAGMRHTLVSWLSDPFGPLRSKSHIRTHLQYFYNKGWKTLKHTSSSITGWTTGWCLVACDLVAYII